MVEFTKYLNKQVSFQLAPKPPMCLVRQRLPDQHDEGEPSAKVSEGQPLWE